MASPNLGIGVLLIVLGLTFWLTLHVAAPDQVWLENLIGELSGVLSTLLTGTPDWLQSLILNGILGGGRHGDHLYTHSDHFLCLMGILEDTGYMARAAFVMDRFMHLMGFARPKLHPAVLGFGCNVPAVVGARSSIPTMRDADNHVSAAGPLYGKNGGHRISRPSVLRSWGRSGVLGSDRVVAGCPGSRRRRHQSLDPEWRTCSVHHGVAAYHLPNKRTIALTVWGNTRSFLAKAATVIVMASLVIWGLSYFPAPRY